MRNAILFKFELTKERKYLLIGGAVLLLMAVLYNLTPTLSALWSQEEALAVKSQKLARYREKVQEKKTLDAKQDALQKVLRRTEAGLLQGKTPALAAVDIQTIIREITERTEAEIKTMRILKPEELSDSNYIAIPVEITLSSDVRQLIGVLYQIETSPQVLRTANVVIRSAGMRRGTNILTTLTIEGFMKKTA